MTRLDRWLLRAYPQAIRTEFADDLTRALVTRRAAHTARFGRIGGVVTLLAGLSDAARSHLAWRRRTPAAPAARPSRASMSWASVDLQYAIRTWRRAPYFYGGVVTTLALGIAANAGVFALLEAVAWRPLPYADQDRVVMFWRAVESLERRAATPSLLLGWRREASQLADVAGVKEFGSLEAAMDLTTATGAERLAGAFATPNFFDVLATRPAAGRLFTAADDAGDGANVVVLSHALWTRSFGADPSIVGRTLTLTNGWYSTRQPRTYRVLGVLGPGFHFNYDSRIEVWVMGSWTDVAREEPNRIGYRVLGRLHPGVSMATLQAHMTAAHLRIDPRQLTLPVGRRATVRIEPIAQWVHGDAWQTLALLGGVAGMLLLITCGTVGSALLIRITERRREFSLRTALGATRGRLLRQLLVEGLVLAAAGTALGIAIAVAALPLLRALVPLDLPRADELTVDTAFVPFVIGIIVAVTLLASAAPAWRGARIDVATSLKQSAGAVSADRATARWRMLLVGLQSGLAAALLLIATMLIISFWQLGRTTLGFAADEVIAVEMRIIDQRVANAAYIRTLQDRLVDRVRAVPGVAEVGLSSAVPFRGVDWTWNVDLPPGSAKATQTANGRQVDPAFFSIMQMTLRRGRLIDASDVAGAPEVAVVSENFARAAFGDRDPLGLVIKNDRPMTIVGVVADVRYAGFDAEPFPAVYVARAQAPAGLICLLVKPGTGSGNLESAILAAIREVDPALPPMHPATIREILAGSTAGRRFYTVATTAFAALALLLTLAGILVIVARAIVERRKELAIRAALGAAAPRLRRLVVRQGLSPVVAGAGLGLTIAFLAAPALAPFLFQIAPRDPRVFAGVGLTIVAAGALAALWPARRMTSAAAVHVLRGE